jgi:ABC-2 type transport system permease protein
VHSQLFTVFRFIIQASKKNGLISLVKFQQHNFIFVGMSKFPGQLKAALTLSRYSLLATLRSPTSVVFSLLFPIIFIVVFGSINPGKAPDIKLAVAAGSDTTNLVFKAIKSIPTIKLAGAYETDNETEDLKKGRIAGIIQIVADGKPNATPHYNIKLQTASSSQQSSAMLNMLINQAVTGINKRVFPANSSVAQVNISTLAGRAYRKIDFILPGQLGFSLLMAGVYGSSFLLFSLRKNLVLKRLRATPVKRWSLITGEMFSRLLFHVISFIIMVLLGYFGFNFTLVNGIATFGEMLLFSLFGVSIFMGIGFIISGVVQNENSIAPIANTFVLPQILLCGLFFPVENYPHWMAQFCQLLPLTLFVDGMRKIAFEGTHIWQLPATIGGLIIWTLIISPLAIKSFRWE